MLASQKPLLSVRNLKTYFPQDGHWAPEGHRMGAEAIRDALARDPE